MKRTKKRRFLRSWLKSRRHLLRSHTRVQRTRSTPLTERRLGFVVKKMEMGESLSASARSLGLRPEIIRHALRSAKVIQKRKGRWRLRGESVAMSIYSEGEAKAIIPADRKNRSAVGKYLNAVKKFRRTNNPESLTPFRKKSVRDIFGKRHRFETDENTLYRLASSGSEAFEEIYRYII